MKKLIAAVIILSMLAAGCARPDNGNVPPQNSGAQTPAPLQTGPVFSQADVLGTWFVSGVIKPKGQKLSDEEFAQLGPQFTLELLSGGVYFVYDTEGKVMGQGTYEVAQDMLTCKAGEEQTVYTIIDANTLHGIAADKSVTVMERCPDAPIDDNLDEEIDDTKTDVPDEDTPDNEA